MAVLYISEYADAAHLQGILPVGKEPSNATQTVAIGGTSTQSAALANNTQFIRLHTDAICSITFGTNPTATTSKPRMAANQTEYFAVIPNALYKVAVISNT